MVWWEEREREGESLIWEPLERMKRDRLGQRRERRVLREKGRSLSDLHCHVIWDQVIYCVYEIFFYKAK